MTKKKCESAVKYAIFYWDGEPKSSRLVYATCRKHMSLGVDKAWKDKEKIYVKESGE